MATNQITKTPSQRKEVVELQIRGLNAKLALLEAKPDGFMPTIRAAAMAKGIDLNAEQRQRISQILNGNVQPADAWLLEIIERGVKLAQKLAA